MMIIRLPAQWTFFLSAATRGNALLLCAVTLCGHNAPKPQTDRPKSHPPGSPAARSHHAGWLASFQQGGFVPRQVKSRTSTLCNFTRSASFHSVNLLRRKQVPVVLNKLRSLSVKGSSCRHLSSADELLSNHRLASADRSPFYLHNETENLPDSAQPRARTPSILARFHCQLYP
jgi:hypothetical protein